jgi:DNA repair exonuclease SbcCD nuclease subunit
MFPETVAARRREQQRGAFANMVRRACDPAAPVDLFLIAGDLFNTTAPAEPDR